MANEGAPLVVSILFLSKPILQRTCRDMYERRSARRTVRARGGRAVLVASASEQVLFWDMPDLVEMVGGGEGCVNVVSSGEGLRRKPHRDRLLIPRSAAQRTFMPQRLLPATHSVPKPLIAVSGTDPKMVTQSLARYYGGTSWYSRSTNAPFAYRYVGIGDNQLSVRRLQMRGYLRGDVATRDQVVVQWLTSGRVVVDTGAEARPLEVGVPTLFPTGRRFFIEAENWDQRLVHLHEDLVRDVAAERQMVSSSLSFRDVPEPSPSAVAQWEAAVAEAVGVLKEFGASSPAGRHAQRQVARALLQMFPLEAGSEVVASGDRAEARLRLAIDYIHANAARPLTLTSLTEVCGLSARGLQQSFRRSFDQSPMAYLRDVRLDRVRAELQSGRAPLTTVRDSARAWGFAHLGRFAAYYFARFGEHPRTTLQR